MVMTSFPILCRQFITPLDLPLLVYGEILKCTKIKINNNRQVYIAAVIYLYFFAT